MRSLTRRATAVRLLSVLSLAATLSVATTSGPTSAAPSTTSVPAGNERCAAIRPSAPAGTTIESVRAVLQPGGTVSFPIQPGYSVPPPPVTDVPAYCQVRVVLNHTGATDHQLIEVWLPESGWTGRFQALGGSGYAAGGFGPELAQAVKDGYVVATTDAGATPITGYTSPWALTDSGRVNVPVLENFAERGPHETAVVGKDLSRTYYAKSVSYAYWNGCSTGGRQGYMEAQRHPNDFDGIVANAPAVSWDRFAVAALWPYVVMNQEKDTLSKCKAAAFNRAATQRCDRRDGLVDGIIGDPLHCDFDPRTLVGTKIDCDGEKQRISALDARVVRKIWDGPRTSRGQWLWYGLPIGASFEGIASGQPFPVSASWVQDFIKRDRGFDLASIDYRDYTHIFNQSVHRYHDVIAGDDPDLAPFRRAGGKLLTWQGLADQLVPVEGTIRYHRAVEKAIGGRHEDVSDFYRLFLAPGAAHCQSGVGPAPTDPMAAMVAWVERGKAPRTLAAATTRADGRVVERDVCQFPLVARYRGHGSPTSASSFHCVQPNRR